MTSDSALLRRRRIEVITDETNHVQFATQSRDQCLLRQRHVAQLVGNVSEVETVQNSATRHDATANSRVAIGADLPRASRGNCLRVKVVGAATQRKNWTQSSKRVAPCKIISATAIDNASVGRGIKL